MKSQEQFSNDLEQNEASGAFEERLSKAERENELGEVRTELESVNARIASLTRTLEAAKKAPLTEEERRQMKEKARKAFDDAKKLGSDDDIAARISRVTEQQFAENLRAGQVADSPQGRELERLKNRQFDLEGRLNQLESDESAS
jgi:hypothetical protein